MTGPTSPAFARPASEGAEAQAGLTRLDFFAAAALTGLLASDTEGTLTEAHAVKWAVSHARALLTALEAEEA